MALSAERLHARHRCESVPPLCLRRGLVACGSGQLRSAQWRGDVQEITKKYKMSPEDLAAIKTWKHS